jgi:hypothetical protein
MTKWQATYPTPSVRASRGGLRISGLACRADAEQTPVRWLR